MDWRERTKIVQYKSDIVQSTVIIPFDNYSLQFM